MSRKRGETPFQVPFGVRWRYFFGFKKWWLQPEPVLVPLVALAIGLGVALAIAWSGWVPPGLHDSDNVAMFGALFGAFLGSAIGGSSAWMLQRRERQAVALIAKREEVYRPLYDALL